ncbi:MAG: hypothetical protein A2Z77_06515 [Chloroflexi bacterium RBG_13_51_36]|nr:MAG: hypothetical protein A2Z77_06515 [Chloroflexi bacterium RBG_13_51_36]
MSAKKRLQEARFFLEELRDSLQSLPQDSPTQMKSCYYLSAFQSAAVSVVDYLLEDANIEFSLGISLDEKLRDIFESKAKEIDNKAALDFLKWWREEREALKNDPIGKLLTDKRHIGIHRRQTKPDLAKIETGGNLSFSGSLGIKHPCQDKLVDTCKTPEQPPTRPKATETNFDWFFSDYPDEPVITVCGKFLDKLARLVSEAERKFPQHETES